MTGVQTCALPILADEAAEWRDKLLEGAANFDDEVMELYLDGQDNVDRPQRGQQEPCLEFRDAGVSQYR